MTCRRCRRKTPTGAVSCPKCGAPLATSGRRGRPGGGNTILEAIARTAARLCEARDAQIILVEGETLCLVVQHGPLRPSRTPGEPFPLSRGTVYGRTALERRVIHVRDLKAIARTRYPEVPGTRVRTMLAVPLLSGDAVLGVIALRRLQARPFTPKQIALLQTFAVQAAIAIEKDRLSEELAARNRDLAEALAQQTATAEILGAISRSPTDLRPVLETLVRAAARFCGAVNVALLRLDGGALRGAAVTGQFGKEFARRFGGVESIELPVNGESATGRAVVERRVVHIHDLALEPESSFQVGRALQREFGHHTMVAAPLLREGVPIGAIDLFRTEVDPFSDKQLALLRTFADQAVIAIENVRLFAELEEKNRALTAAHAQVTEALEQRTATGDILSVISTSTTDAQPVFQTIAEAAVRLSGALFGSVYRFDGELIHMVAHHNYPPAAREFSRRSFPTPPTRQVFTGRAILERAVVHVPDVAHDEERAAVQELAEVVGFRSALSVPMLRDGIPIGAITVWGSTVGSFSDSHIALLRTFADQAVIAVENARLFEELEARNRDLTEALEQQTATAEILRVISTSPTNLQPVLDTLAASAARFCGSYDGSIFHLEGHTLRLGAHHGPLDSHPVGLEVPVVRGAVMGRSILDREAVHVADLQAATEEFPEGSAIARRLGFHTLLCVPLMREGAAIGAIGLRRIEVNPFTDKQIALARTFADQAVIAIENVRLFTELQEKNRALTRAHAQVTETLEQQTATSEILGVISSSPTDIQPVFDAIVEHAGQLCRGIHTIAVRIEGNAVTLAAHNAPSAEAREQLSGSFPRPLEGMVGGMRRALVEGQVAEEPDIASDPEYPAGPWEASRIWGYRARLIVPMLRGGRPIGAIAVGRAQASAFSDHEITLLQTFADQAVIAIENVRLFNELETRNRDLTEALEQQTATSDVLRVISGSPTDVQPVFDTILESATRLCAAENGILFRYNDEAFHTVACRGLSFEAEAAFRGQPAQPGPQSGLGRMLAEKRLVQVEDVRDDMAYRQGDPLRIRTVTLLGARTAMWLPLLKHDAVIGALAIYRHEVRPFTAKQIELIRTFADQAVIAIENVRLFKELEARNHDLSEALEQQTATAEILGVISGSPTDVQPVFDAIAKAATALCVAENAGVFLFDGRLIHFAAHYNWTERDLEALREAFPRPPGPGTVTSQAILTRAVAHTTDIAADPAYEMRGFVDQGFHTIMSVPMLRDGDPIGAISVTRREAVPFSDRQIALLKTFADQAVIAIENVRLFKELEARNRDLTVALEQQTATSEILRVISQSQTDVQPVFDAIVRSAMRLCGGVQGNIQRFDGELMHLVATHHWQPDAVELIHRMFPVRPDSSRSSSSRAVLTGAVVNIPDVFEESGYDLSVPRLGGFRSVLSVPMFREQKPIGSITVIRAEVGLFSENHVDLLKTFADQAVIAIENVRLFNELKTKTSELTQSVEQLTALGEIGRAVTSTLDVETVLETVVSRARQLAGADGCLIYEYDEGSQQFHSRATDNLDAAYAEALRGVPIRKGEGVSGRAAEMREAVQVADITQLSAYQSSVRDITIQAGYRAVLSVPLLREDEIIGSLILIRKTPGEFSPEIVELLKTFATQSALAIQNARLFREIEDKGRELELASKHKSQFLANMSHELRTPLNAILGYTELLLDGIYGEVSEKARETMGRIERSGRHLLALINDVLDLSKIEAGQLTLSLADYSLSEIVNTVVTAMEPLAAGKGLALRIALAPDLPLARGDDRRLSQVLLNLVGNAVKFTDAGEVRIQAKVSDGAFLISVSDTGPGIAAEDQARIFDEFQQVDSSNTRKKGGTGLGLSIARRILALHGGRIWVESTPGQGATFSFTLPVRVERMV